MGKPVVLRPVVAKAEGNPRMQHAEQNLQKATMKYRSQESITKRHRTQTITMTETELLS